MIIHHPKFLKKVLSPASHQGGIIEEMVEFCKSKNIDPKIIQKDCLNTFQYSIFAVGFEYVLDNLNSIGKQPLQLHEQAEEHGELIAKFFMVIYESFLTRKEEPENTAGYKMIKVIQDVILENLFKISINTFRCIRSARYNFSIYLRIMNYCFQGYIKKCKNGTTKFKPLMQTIIENMIQISNEIGKTKEVNAVMLNLPATMRAQLEFMPSILPFILSSLRSNDA